MRNRAVFLDRDGVINRAVVREGRPYPPDSAASMEVLPQVPQALEALREGGYLLIVVTNQPDVRTGKQSLENLEEMHRRLRAELPLDDIRTCLHVDGDECECRKPKPGMLLAAARQWGIDTGDSYMVGDRWRDVEAGRAAGCRTLLIEAGYAEKRVDPDLAVASLWEASRAILAGQV